MRSLVLFLEERSAEVMLAGLLPRLLPSDVRVTYIVFEGKSDLEKNLEKKLRGWLEPDAAFMVLRDQDSGDCVEVKSRLTAICKAAGKPSAIVRIACSELESWYLGELEAVERAFRINGLAKKGKTAKFRNPDQLKNASEELRKLTKGAYQKVGGSRAMGSLLKPERNQSRSYQVFLAGIGRLFPDQP